MNTLETRSNGSFPPTLVIRNRIGSEERDGLRTLEARSACHHEDLVAVAPASSADDVKDACRAAQEAYSTWSAVPAPVRGEIIGRVGVGLRKNKELLSRVVCREIGKTMREARGEVQEAIDTAAFFQAEGRRLYGQTVHSEMPNKELFTYRRPLGVAAMITAGNFPIAVPSWKILPALVCGNTVVWKPSEDAPAIAYLFARLFGDAGLPPGVLNLVFGTGAEAGAAVLENVDTGLIQKVSFTGSTEVGRKVGEVCGRNLQVPSLELGGKNPMVVMPDANIEAAIEGALFSGYGTAGQRCTSLGNLILDRRIADDFLDRLLARLKEVRIGNPTLSEDVLYGPLIHQRFHERFMKHFDIARTTGAKNLVETEGRISAGNPWPRFEGDPSTGYYVHPVLWHGASLSDAISQTEVFGPTVNVLVVDGFEEALRAANGTPYGLSSSIYTQDPSLIFRFKTGITAGMTSVNNTTSGAEAHLPFGGNGWSGNGTRESGIWVLDAYTRWHSVNEDLAGKLQLAQIDVDFGTEAPKATDFPPLHSNPSNPT
jgi:alpha-ketoglutaric semialdehyde dehydrogenase